MLLRNAPLYYPSARQWMWNYCIYLGPFTDSKSKNYDLGIYIEYSKKLNMTFYSNATVYGNRPGQYLSGDFFGSEYVNQVIIRANFLGLVQENNIWHKDNSIQKHLFI